MLSVRQHVGGEDRDPRRARHDWRAVKRPGREEYLLCQ